MKNIYFLAKKELKIYFYSPIAYSVAFMFLLIAGYFFYSDVLYFSLISLQARSGFMGLDITDWVIRPLLGNMSVVLLLILPLLTMRLFAEERRQGSLELLLTYPLRDIELVLGKFFGCLAVYALMLAFTIPYPIILYLLGRTDISPFFTGYLGIFLMGSAFIALGLFISSLTESQIVAAVITFGLSLLFWIINWATHFTGPPLSKILEAISIITHFEDFMKGIIDTAHIIFYLSFISLSLFLTLRVLESRRIRG